MRRANSFVTVFAAAIVILLSSGCAGQKELIMRQEAAIDSMQATHDALRAELVVLRDSLQFYDDIDSGQYYRDRRVLTQEIQGLQYDIAICRDGGKTIETLLVDELFEPASASLTEAGQTRLTTLADTLREHYPDRALRVEGYSDSTPIGPTLTEKYPSNWELSADRAAAVVRFLLDVEGMAPDRVEVVSFGATHPIAKNDTVEGRRKNRRIRIAALPE